MQLSKIKQRDALWTLSTFPSMVTFCKVTVKYHNQVLTLTQCSYLIQCPQFYLSCCTNMCLRGSRALFHLCRLVYPTTLKILNSFDTMRISHAVFLSSHSPPLSDGPSDSHPQPVATTMSKMMSLQNII